MPAPASGGHTATIDGKLYVFGGYQALGAPMAHMLAFDPARGTWDKLPRVPASCVATAAAYGGLLHVLAGDDDELDPDEEDNKATHHYVYDPATNVWREAKRLPTNLTPRRNNNGLHSPAILLATPERLHLLTFQLPAKDYDSLGLHTWVPETNSWQKNDAKAFSAALNAALPPRATPSMDDWTSGLGRGRLFAAAACELG